MTQSNEKSVFNVIERREIKPVIRPFPYPKEYEPKNGFGVYMAEGFLKEIKYLAGEDDIQLEHYGLLFGHYFKTQ